MKMKEKEPGWFDKTTQALDRMSEQGIRRVLYTMIQTYPAQAKIVIDAIILKQREIIK